MLCLDSITSRNWEWGRRGGVDIVSERYIRLEETLSNSSVSDVIIVFVVDPLILSKHKCKLSAFF